MNVQQIPPNLFWIIGKGRNRPSEPLFAVQLLDPETRIAVAEAEHEDLDQAIALAVASLPS